MQRNKDGISLLFYFLPECNVNSAIKDLQLFTNIQNDDIIFKVNLRNEYV